MGGGFKPKTLRGGSMDIFWNNTKRNDDDHQSLRYQLSSKKKRAGQKNSGMNGIGTHDLCNTGAPVSHP